MLTDASLTERLRDYFEGKPGEIDDLLHEILPKLRDIAARESRRERQPALSPTELIHEVWMRNLSKATWTIRDRAHFYAIASLAMRRVLTDMARKRLANRRNWGEQAPFESLSIANGADKDARQIAEVGILMDRLEKELPDSARVVDMHYFAGFTFREIAETTQLTERQIRRRWASGVHWLKQNCKGATVI